MTHQPLFADRAEAGQRLADALAVRALDQVVVYALPRGGVPVAFEIARRLNAPLDLVLVRKIGAPGQPELAVAAVVDGERPQVVFNEDVRRMTGASEKFIQAAQSREVAEIERRRTLYFGNRARPDPAGRTAIVVDDGLATGATARAAIRGLRGQGVKQVILAVPVAPAETVAAMEAEVDELICLATPARFWGVGSFYADFHQLSDDEVLSLLDRARQFGEAA